jgi:hypothetical protein
MLKWAAMPRKFEVESGRGQHPWRRGAGSDPVLRRRIVELEAQLSRRSKQLEDVIQDYESAIEELRATREEVHATNEELQAAAQELSDEREHLRRSLAEFGSKNESLLRRLKESSETSEELACLLDTLDIPVLQLGADLTVRHFTAAAARLWNLVSTDLGRPVADFSSALKLPRLGPLCHQAMADLTSLTAQVHDSAGNPMSLLVRPFAGRKNRVVRIAVILLPQASEIVTKPMCEAVSFPDILESSLPRIQAALGEDTDVEIAPGQPPLYALTDPVIFERVLVRSVLAAQQTVTGPARVSIASRAVEAEGTVDQASPCVPPGSYVAVSIVTTPLSVWKPTSGRAPRAMQVPEFPIRELGAFYRVEYSPGLDSRLILYLTRAKL